MSDEKTKPLSELKTRLENLSEQFDTLSEDIAEHLEPPTVLEMLNLNLSEHSALGSFIERSRDEKMSLELECALAKLSKALELS